MKDLGKLINKMIDKAVVGCDKYVHNDSTWLIFTDEKKWVIELTKDGTLWYNYNFFKNLFKVLSLDVVENQNYITKWVEDTIISGVKYTGSGKKTFFTRVEETIQNGVKTTTPLKHGQPLIGDAIQNGVRSTRFNRPFVVEWVEDTIQNGVKHTKAQFFSKQLGVEDTIQNGVKHTRGNENQQCITVEDTIQNGVKETKTPGEDGDILGAVDFMSDNNTVNIPQLIDDVIKNGIKRTEGGILFDETKVDRIISEGVKETKSGGYLGSIEMKGKIVHQIESPKQNNEVGDVIQNGIKETHDDVYHHKGRVDGVIKNGVKDVNPAYRLIYNPMTFEPVISEEKRIVDITDVIRDGIKETKPMDEWVNTTNIVGKVISKGISI